MTCYNRAETTLRCLRLLSAQKCNADLTVFLVDDASPDRTGERVLNEFPQVHVILGTGSLYWTKGMNLAWKTAGDGYDAYLWLNDDVELADGALAGLISDADATGWNGAVVGSFLDGGGKMTYGVLENWKWIEPAGTPRHTKGDISGNCVLVPRSVAEKVGITPPMPELLQEDFTPKAVADQLAAWLGDSDARKRAVESIEATLAHLRSDGAALGNAAREILACVRP